MPPENFDPRGALILMLMARAGDLVFRRLTGMSLDEWDEMNYRRVMS